VASDLTVAAHDYDIHRALLLRVVVFVGKRHSRGRRMPVRPGAGRVNEVAAGQALVATLRLEAGGQLGVRDRFLARIALGALRFG
jgi:hypothetical protein